MRAARPTIPRSCEIVGRASLTRRYRATLSPKGEGTLETTKSQIVKGVPQQKEFRLGIGMCSDGQHIESICRVVQTMLCHVSVRGTNDALLFLKTYGVLRRIGILSSFDFHEDKNISIPRDDVDFSAFYAISGSNNAVPQCAQVVDGLKFRTPAEGQQAVKE